MALVIVPPNQQPGQVAGNLTSIAKRLGEPLPVTDTSGPTISFVVSSAVAREWSGVKPEPVSAEPAVQESKPRKNAARKKTGGQ